MSVEMQPMPLVPDHSLHWGATLRAARVVKNLTQEQVATTLKLTIAQIEAIESERIADVHASALFAKGYVSNYAQLLGVELSSDHLASMSAQQTLHSVNHVNEYFAPQVKSRKKSWWLFLVVLLAVLAWQFFADAQLLVLVSQSGLK